jgi:DNA (cytosine-5)-methyltransferase 1
VRVLDLFSGIGGFSLGLERAGMRTVAFCEIDPFCRAVLAKHWPGVPCHDDITTFRPERGSADVVCGGFPCQDISVAGAGAGLSGARSGLWSELARVIGLVRPHFAIVENVSALLGRGLGTVLGDLASIGYDAEWHCIPAAAAGAPHRRDRIWIVAYPRVSGLGRLFQPERELWCGIEADAGRDGQTWAMADSDESRQIGWRQQQQEGGKSARDVADADDAGSQRRGREIVRERASERTAGAGGSPMADSEILGCGQGDQDRGGRSSGTRQAEEWRGPPVGGWWLTEPDVGRVAHGVPRRVDRLRALGNAVVPQVVEVIGRAIMRSSQNVPEGRT